jgi:tryptophan-rich sensory protein
VRAFQIFDTSGGDPRAPRLADALAWIGFVGLCFLVGGAANAITMPAVRGWYLTLSTPPGTPPNWVFGPVWGVLYVLVGTAAWRIWRRPAIGQRAALRLWGWQLLVNALWSPAFFGLHSPAAGLAIILPLLGLIIWTIARFSRLDRVAAGLLLPYAVWSTYATYLNAGFFILNPG